MSFHCNGRSETQILQKTVVLAEEKREVQRFDLRSGLRSFSSVY